MKTERDGYKSMLGRKLMSNGLWQTKNVVTERLQGLEKGDIGNKQEGGVSER